MEFGNGTADILATIPRILNFVQPLISGRRKLDHVSDSDVRNELGWLNSSQLLHYQSLSLLHKIINRHWETECIANQIFTTTKMTLAISYQLSL